FSGFTKESIAFGAKGEGSLLNINDRALSEQSAKSTKKPTQTTQMPYRIVNFATVATPLRLEGEAAYAASKAALVNLTQVCAKELSEFGITIN
ncbi:SDR family NAD(P)-dependent oxidoreductase, partial [Helicobacter cinaedi]